METLRENPALTPFVLSNVRFTGARIGAGAYGSVEEVTIPGAICAAKRIHDFFQDSSQISPAEIHRTSTQFVSECQLMSTLRHPHIVQFLGVCFFPGSRLPALVMERLLTSLHDLLDPETDPPPPPNTPKPFIPLSLKCSILHNVASGLAYLHEQTPPIIHRDLSARNILLNSGMVAKIADLGVARIVPRMNTAATMTKTPGTSVYMPPEALEDYAQEDEEGKMSKYDASIDIFSFGVLSVFALCQYFPCKLLAPNYRKGDQHIARTELERRERYMKMIYSQLREQHPLIQTIERCLQFPENRPTTSEVLHLLERAKAESSEDLTSMNKLELLQTLQTQRNPHHFVQKLPSHRQEVTDLQQRLESSELEMQTLRQQTTRKETELARSLEIARREQQQRQQRERELAQAIHHIRETHKEVQAKDNELSLIKKQLREKEEQLHSSEALVATFQITLQEKDDELDLLRKKGAAQAPQSRAIPTHYSAGQIESQSTLPSALHSASSTTVKKLSVQCHRKKSAPRKMTRGSATTDHQVSYFTPYSSNSVYKYQWSTDKWEKLPPCPHHNSALVIIDRELTAVGGWDGLSQYISKLVTLQQKKWVEIFPPMNVARSSAAVVSTASREYVIVIGGNAGGGRWTTSVELFEVSSGRWHEVTYLPQPLSCPSATICSTQLYVVGGDAGYQCSLYSLLSSDRHVTEQTIPHLVTSWTPLPCLPATESTAATLSSHLVIAGGSQGSGPVNSIYQLLNGRWAKVGSTSRGRKMCLVVSPSPRKMMIVGGMTGELIAHDIVEDCITL